MKPQQSTEEGARGAVAIGRFLAQFFSDEGPDCLAGCLCNLADDPEQEEILTAASYALTGNPADVSAALKELAEKLRG